jgi:hypothetical protein
LIFEEFGERDASQLIKVVNRVKEPRPLWGIGMVGTRLNRKMDTIAQKHFLIKNIQISLSYG